MKWLFILLILSAPAYAQTVGMSATVRVQNVAIGDDNCTCQITVDEGETVYNY